MRFVSFTALAALLSSVSFSSAETIWGVDQHNVLFKFDSLNPSAILDARPINNLSAVVALDFRPADEDLYALTEGGGIALISLNSTNQVFSGSLAGGLGATYNGSSFGFDFDPLADRLRVVSDTDINLLRQVGGLSILTPQTTLSAAYGNPSIVGAAYSNNFEGTTSTTLYTIDAGSDTLNIQNPASSGIQTVVGPLGIDVRSEEVGFDIAQSGVAYLVANPAGQRDSNLYTVNLTTGQATLVGLIGQGVLARDISVFIVPEPASMLLCLGCAGLLRRR
jgi:Domain of unknown function (DUF4394)